MVSLRNYASGFLRYVSNLHVAGRKPAIFLLSTPRSGSTWLMEIIAADHRIRPCNEPFNIRQADVSRRLGITSWESLLNDNSLPKIEKYITCLMKGGFGYTSLNPIPFSKGYKPFTNRVVFKILFALEEQIGWLRKTFDCQVIALVRHPIPVSLSREKLPRLPDLINSESVQSLLKDQREFAWDIFKRGSPLERAQLDWCLQNIPLLRDPKQLDLLLTYEQLVLQPDLAIAKLAEVLDLEDRERLEKASKRLSSSVSKSTDANKKILEDSKNDRLALVTKWKSSITESDELRAMTILSNLGIDAYKYGSVLPSRPYWIGDDYPSGMGKENTPRPK